MEHDSNFEELTFSKKINEGSHFTFREKERIFFEREGNGTRTKAELVIGPYTVLFGLVVLGVIIWISTSDVWMIIIDHLKSLKGVPLPK